MTRTRADKHDLRKLHRLEVKHLPRNRRALVQNAIAESV